MAYFASWADFNLTRVLVLASAVVLLVFGILALQSGGSTVHLILCIVVIVIAALGIIGAICVEIMFLQLYLLLLVALFIWELVYIIITAVDGDYKNNNNRLGYDIVVLIVLFICAALTSHLISRALWGRGQTVSTIVV